MVMLCYVYEDINLLLIFLGMSKKIVIVNILKVLKLFKCEYLLICFLLLYDFINYLVIDLNFEVNV